MRIALLSGGFPPDLDGIGDYTWWQSSALAEKGHEVFVFTSTGPARISPEGVTVVPFFQCSDQKSVAGLVSYFGRNTERAAFDCLVVQYNPFSFGRRGFCPALLATLRRIQAASGICIAVMFHETMVPRWPWRFSVMFLWQYPIFRSMCRLADVAFISTERWALQIRPVASNLQIRHLPVGSTIVRGDFTRSQAREELGISPNATVVGMFGQLHASRPLSWISVAVRAIAVRDPQTKFLYVGPHGRQLQASCPELDVIDAGMQTKEEAGRYFVAMNAMVCPFLDGASTRRTSLMAAIQFGVPVATTRTCWTDEVLANAKLDALLLSKSQNAEDFAKDVASWYEAICEKDFPDRELTSFYDRNFSWEKITDMMLETLEPLVERCRKK